MVHLNLRRIFQICDRPRDFENPVLRTPTQVELRDGGFEQIFRSAVHVAELLDRLTPHLHIRSDADALHPLNLLLPGFHNSSFGMVVLLLRARVFFSTGAPLSAAAFASLSCFTARSAIVASISAMTFNRCSGAR
ncbi:hypothetical protein IAD21_00266 [Abditibacteriota bacterium]|nr:hypothetical protein IAD21_00266 [Abditibacteriota bacterium]